MANTVENLMKVLGCTEQEAKQILEDDKKIDRGEKLFELTPEQQKASKKARQTGTKKKTVYNFDVSKRKRKENPDKAFLIEIFKKTLESQEATNIEVINPEREMVFSFNDVGYKIVLSVPRGSKKE